MKNNISYNGNPLLKKSNVQIQWTKELINEWNRCKNNPLHFVTNYVSIVTEDGLVIMKPFKYQKDIINSILKNRNTIITTARQAGKTSATVAAILWYILFNTHKSVGILANKAETARSILSRLKVAFQHLPKWLQHGVVVWNEKSVEFENGCKIIADATTSDSIRGYTFQMIFIDEAAHIENWEDFFSSVYPTISAGKKTKIVLVSTPNGLNHFWNIWMGANEKEPEKSNGYNPIFVTWKDVPGRDQKWYDNTIKGLNYNYDTFNQEYNAEFMGSSGTLIAGWKLKELYPFKPVAESSIGLKQFEVPIKDHVYWMVVDVSRGKGLDHDAFQIIDVSKMPYKQVATFRSNIITPYDFSEIIYRNCKLYNDAFLLIENKDIGAQVCDLLYYDFEYENILRTEQAGKQGKRICSGTGGNMKISERGVATSVQVKAVGCSVLKLLIEQNQLLIIDYETIQELSRFSKKGKSYEAEEGYHDDLTICLVLFSWATQNQFFKDTTDINTLQKIREQTDDDLTEMMIGFAFFKTDGNEELIEKKTLYTKTWLTDFLNDDSDRNGDDELNNLYKDIEKPLYKL